MATAAINHAPQFPNLTIADIDRKDGLRAGFYTITPMMAEFIITNRNGRNRPIYPSKMMQIMSDMREGRFEFNGESIVFGDDGELSDGQHRTKAGWETGIPFVSLVAFGLSRGSQDTIDQGKPRGVGDVLSLDGYPNGNELAATARMMVGYKRGNRSTLTNLGQYSRLEILAEVADNPKIVECVSWALTFKKKLHGVCPPPLVAFVRAVMEPIYGDEVVYFLERIAIGDGLTNLSPALAARNRLIQGGKQPRFVKVEILMRGCLAHVENRPLSRIQLDGKLPLIG